ncbi:cofactor-independent phosphoglycerate mutase [Velocimicrobium porci]|uniref:Cofactor-independent phosphoglycerate mutase n=1 Tax=Velocimicrobium porci TaxID=2606634 RepID=A0A6L5XY88_9FIRM|nr:cofactor-independent phosphoglycerate mutase [Velocimicrobium porci]MSS63840.1 cofactor-independent phosphoglycerate mutase [Velocimicrobium porci]
MKYIIVLGDGMADDQIEMLGGKTPLAYAKTPMMDQLSKYSEIGMVHTIPEGMSPGSDTANLAVMGYNPRKYYTGRSPLEALSIGVPMKDTDIALRCNIVTLSEEDVPYEQRTMIDHSASEISTEEARILIEAVKKGLENEEFSFYTGTSYRHLTIWDHGKVIPLTPPHDILTKKIGAYLPTEEKLKVMMEKSFEILKNHPINLERESKGLHKANSLWFWGAGTKPALDSFESKFQKKGAMISAVDLLKGIAVGAGMKVIKVEGADGTLHTNYEGKANAAVKALLQEDCDFAYIHVEAPDEMGHQGNIKNKVLSIEYLDQRIIKPVVEKMNQSGLPYRLLVLPDHPTPIAIRTHTAGSVPYMLYSSAETIKKDWDYNEKEAENSGNYIEEGYTLIERLFEG